MTRPPLERLLRPKSIAVIGGGAWCEAVLQQCRQSGFAGSLYAVHPSRKNVAGISAWPDVADLPEAPDASFIGINRDATLATVGALARRGAGGAVCFANGFAESADGQERQRNLLTAAGELAVLGPNCYGFLNNLDGVTLWPDQHGCRRVSTGVALITQSSNIALNLTMQRRALPLAYVVTCGNQAQQGLATIASTLLDDSRVTALGLHVEGFGDIRALERLAGKAHALGKPIVVLKTGKTRESRQATLSHTASLAGSDAGAEALLARLGMASATSLTALLETLKILHLYPGGMASSSTGPLRVASLSCSGGEAALVADTARLIESRLPARHGMREGQHFTFPEPGEARHKALENVLGERVAIHNPLDYDTGIWRDEAALAAVYRTMSGADIDVTLLILDFPRDDRCDPIEWQPVTRALESAAHDTGTCYAVVASLPESLPESIATRLMSAGIVPLAGLEEAFQALHLATRADRGPGLDASQELLLDDTARRSTLMLSEHAAKRQLAAFGLDVPRSQQADNPADAGEVAARLGFPVVLKGEGIAHKSDVGAVVVGLCDQASTVTAAENMPVTRFLVEAQMAAAEVELLIGIIHDPAHGFVLTLAAGGVLTELLADRVSLLLPTTDAAIGQALDQLRVARAIDGLRGRAGADRDAIVDAVLSVQSFVIANAARVQEVEINPLSCRRDAVTALDALIVLGKDTPSSDQEPPS